MKLTVEVMGPEVISKGDFVQTNEESVFIDNANNEIAIVSEDIALVVSDYEGKGDHNPSDGVADIHVEAV